MKRVSAATALTVLATITTGVAVEVSPSFAEVGVDSEATLRAAIDNAAAAPHARRIELEADVTLTAPLV